MTYVEKSPGSSYFVSCQGYWCRVVKSTALQLALGDGFNSLLQFQADVERKLSQMILDKKFHGESLYILPYALIKCREVVHSLFLALLQT